MPSNDSLERVVLNLMSLFGKGVPELSADKMKNIFTDPKSATQSSTISRSSTVIPGHGWVINWGD